MKPSAAGPFATWLFVGLGVLGLGEARAQDAPAATPTADAGGIGFDADRLHRLDAAVEAALAQAKLPGAVVLVGRGDRIGYVKAFGRRAVQPAEQPMTRDTIFDMASLTKPVATATSVMILIDEGKIRLSDRLIKFLPEFDNHGKGQITIEHLLRHRAGLMPDNAIGDYKDGPEEAWKKLAALSLDFRPGERFVYSDVGFEILGRLVEKVSGQTLDQFARERIYQPAGMTDAHFRPTAGDASKWPNVDRIAPTEPAEPGQPVLRGAVHDPRSRALGGVAGHAGLFATADDLSALARTLLNKGVAPSGKRILSPLAVRMMLDTGDTPPSQRRGLGWDVETDFSSPRGELFGPSSFGHTGFTGTSIWIDPETRAYVIILTSRLHPDNKAGSTTPLRRMVATLAAAAVTDLPAPAPKPAPPVLAARRAPILSVKCGIDVLASRDFAPLRGRRVGLITNHTGQAADGRSTIDVLFHAPEVKLVRLFSPEHGVRGALDVEKIANDVDEATKLPIVSLYEGKKRKPSTDDLADLDVLVYDIQDIGVRYYTYISTLGLVLEAAKSAGKKVVVLDRPNPIGGLGVGGPVRDDDQESFIAYHSIPIRHGMTVGELAKLYNTERKIEADLEVVPCEGWTRDATYDRTGLRWVNPSPNMRSLTEALLYPGVGWLEATNLATGRGTDTPFERVGAPWIKPAEWAKALNDASIPGSRFVPIEFVPSERQYKGERCGGVQILVVDWSTFDPIKLGLGLASTLRKGYKDQWKPDRLQPMLADHATYQAILDGKTAGRIEGLWVQELADFAEVRDRYLIYPE
ncbi:exo-beta-N-acetylmuramidase NamZ domain-containing protein [Paludisphaera borealis]|uniref:Esterase EstB n=1 Tax=Paludisphaera borealis TaxID=1387353 RepID=A0A1U7CYI5_9BACT|nr:exo-beta-N-acetylmuramidase NamZ domain-containing protein [Paludisphaera borealis]APW63939.1 Esterase EstB [Paludisphaera borealis]